MSNAVGRLLGTLGSGVLYTYAGNSMGPLSGTDARFGLFACFIAGTISSALAAVITLRIRDEAAGLRCGTCICVASIEKQSPAGETQAPAGEKQSPADELKIKVETPPKAEAPAEANGTAGYESVPQPQPTQL